jgi:hypothetical protein
LIGYQAVQQWQALWILAEEEPSRWMEKNGLVHRNHIVQISSTILQHEVIQNGLIHQIYYPIAIMNCRSVQLKKCYLRRRGGVGRRWRTGVAIWPLFPAA